MHSNTYYAVRVTAVSGSTIPPSDKGSQYHSVLIEVSAGRLLHTILCNDNKGVKYANITPSISSTYLKHTKLNSLHYPIHALSLVAQLNALKTLEPSVLFKVIDAVDQSGTPYKMYAIK